MTILDCCISLKPNIFFLVVLGVVDMRQLLLNGEKSADAMLLHKE